MAVFQYHCVQSGKKFGGRANRWTMMVAALAEKTRSNLPFPNLPFIVGHSRRCHLGAIEFQEEQLMKMLISALALATASAVQAATPAPAPVAAAVPKAITRAAFIANVDTNFQRNDANRDGSLTKVEIGATEARAQQQLDARLTVRRKEAFDRVDANHDGSVSFAEFAAASPTPKADDGSKAIAVLDTNRDGKVSVEEFRAPALKRFEAVDKNHDGIASVDEMRGNK